MEPCSASQDSTTDCKASETLSLMLEPSAKAMNFIFQINSLLRIIVVRASPSLQPASTDGRGAATSFVSCFAELDFPIPKFETNEFALFLVAIFITVLLSIK